MSQYRTILVIADPDHPGSAALRRAGALARGTAATLQLRTFVHHGAIDALHMVNAEVADLARKELMRERREWLEREADSLRARDLNVRTDVIWGHPVHEKIVSEALSVRPDLVLKDVQKDTALQRLLFRGIDWHLLRLCPAPLLMVGAEARDLPKRIVASVDTSIATPENAALNDEIVRVATQLAAPSGATVDVVHAWEGLPPITRGTIEGPAVLTQDVYHEVEKARAEGFRKFAERRNIAPERRHFRIGTPNAAITGFVSESGADVVVMGTLSRSPLERVIIGSTAEQMLDELECDVLVVKPAAYTQALLRAREQKAA